MTRSAHKRNVVITPNKGDEMRLTKAQTRAVKYAWTDRDGTLRVDTSECSVRTWRVLHRLGLTEEWSWALSSAGAKMFHDLNKGAQ